MEDRGPSVDVLIAEQAGDIPINQLKLSRTLGDVNDRVAVAVDAAGGAVEDEVAEATLLMIQITQVIGSPDWALIPMMSGTA